MTGLNATWTYQVLAGLLFWPLKEALQTTGPHRQYGRPCQVCMQVWPGCWMRATTVPKLAVLWVERLLGPVVSASECIWAFPYIWIWQGAPRCNGDKGHVISHKFHQDRHAQTWCESVRHATYYKAKRVVPPAVPVPVWKSDHDPTKSDNVCPSPQGITEASSAVGTSLQSGAWIFSCYP